MKLRIKLFALLICCCGTFVTTWAQETKQWTLQECIDYALENNIQLKKSSIKKQSSHEDVLQSQADLLPSLSASTSQSKA